MFGESARPCMFGLMELERSSEEKLEPLTNHPRNAFSISFMVTIGDPLKVNRVRKKPWKDVSELPEWNYDGSSTGQARDEISCNRTDSEHVRWIFQSTRTQFSSLFSSRIQFWLLFEAGANISRSIPVRSTYSRSLWSSWFWQKSSCNKSQILLQ